MNAPCPMSVTESGISYARKTFAIGKRLALNGCDRVRDRYVRKTFTFPKRRIPDRCDGVGDRYAYQSFTPVERVAPDGSDSARNFHSFCAALITIQNITNNNQSSFISQPLTTIERTVPDEYDRVGDCYACQASAAGECLFPDGCDGVGDRYACQAFTPVERHIPDGCDRVRDRYACQTFTHTECLTPNGCDGAGNFYSSCFAFIVIQDITNNNQSSFIG